jgi:hypothetical protein
MDVVLHLNTDETTKQSELLGNLKNLHEDKSVNTEEIAVVLNSDGVKMLESDAEAAEFLEQNISEGVTFYGCSNSLDNRDIGREDLVHGVKRASSGIGKLAELQQSGFNYIKI